MRSLVFLIPIVSMAAIVPADISGVRPGPVTVSASAETLTVRWPDEASRMWTAEFSLNSEKPLITTIGLDADRHRPQRLAAILGDDRETPRSAPGSTSSSIFREVIPREPGGSRAHSGPSAPRRAASVTGSKCCSKG